uniref:Integrase catalytic domain-containing protein n=1 Tax=Strongyloides papillosus TaxID=174720 RepID=A0A0N5BMH4_STREA
MSNKGNKRTGRHVSPSFSKEYVDESRNVSSYSTSSGTDDYVPSDHSESNMEVPRKRGKSESSGKESGKKGKKEKKGKHVTRREAIGRKITDTVGKIKKNEENKSSEASFSDILARLDQQKAAYKGGRSHDLPHEGGSNIPEGEIVADVGMLTIEEPTDKVGRILNIFNDLNNRVRKIEGNIEEMKELFQQQNSEIMEMLGGINLAIHEIKESRRFRSTVSRSKKVYHIWDEEHSLLCDLDEIYIENLILQAHNRYYGENGKRWIENRELQAFPNNNEIVKKAVGYMKDVGKFCKFVADILIPQEYLLKFYFPSKHTRRAKERLFSEEVVKSFEIAAKYLGSRIIIEERKKRLLDILWNSKEAFYEYDGKPGLYSGSQHLGIKLKTNEIPKKIKPFQMSHEKEAEVSKQIADMFLTVEFRGINKLIEQQSHVIPRIDRITEEAAGKRYYTSFDLKAGFHQIPLDDSGRKIAAFVTHEGVFQYKVMPMGLTGSPDKCAYDEETHLKNIYEIICRIKSYNSKINIAKCQSSRPSAKYLGFILNKKGIHPNPDKTIFTDTSTQGLGAALVQQDRPIAFASRSLKPAEKNYSIIKLEVFGLVYALKQFRPYIYGKHTVVITDHKPLLALLKNKELTGILQRYQMTIMEYDLTIQYIKGEANNIADYLSRESFMAIDAKENLYEEVFPPKTYPPYYTDKFINYYNDKEKEIIPSDGKVQTPTGIRIYVPELLREKLLSVDNEYVFVMVDEYNKYVVATCCKKQNGPTLLHILLKCSSLLRFPKMPRSDNGPAFIAKTVTDYLKSVGVEQQFSSPHNHKSNAYVERFNRTLRSAIRIYKNQPLTMVVPHFVYTYNRAKSLSTGLSLAQRVVNTPDRSVSDENIHNGYSGIHELIKNTKSQFEQDKIDRKGLQLNPGDLVLRRVMHRKDAKTSHKNQPIWEGPFKVLQHLYGDTYEIEDTRKHRKTRLAIEKIHSDRLKKYIQE